MIVLGSKHRFTELEMKKINRYSSDIHFISVIDSSETKVIAQISQAISASKKNRVMILNHNSALPNTLLTYLTQLQRDGVIFYTMKSFLQKKLRKMYIPEKNTDVSFLEEVRPYTCIEYFIKRVIDITASLGLLAVFWPFMVYSVYRIKKESPGPILFKQDRVGFLEKEFSCIKFRSMIIDAEKQGAQFASADDPRVFKWGKIMRKTRIDELPQLYNVLIGDMHLVGPRPERKIWVDQFEKEIAYYNERHLVRPGITGWAQVMYPYGENVKDAYQKLTYDLYYMKKWSVILEVETILKTIMVVLSRRGY